MNIVALDFGVRWECTPSPLITIYRYSHVPMICDFLYNLSQAMLPYPDSTSYSFPLVYSVGLSVLESSLIRMKRMKMSTSLFFQASGKLTTTSSSMPMPTFNLRMVLLPISPRHSESLVMRAQGITFLFISNSLSKNASQVEETSFFSYNTTPNLLCYEPLYFSEHLPLDFIYGLVAGVVSGISSSLLRCYQSEEEVPNSSFLSFMSSFLRVIFILMYSQCIRLNSSSFSQSLSSPAYSPLCPVCWYQTYLEEGLTGEWFLEVWLTTRLLLLGYCMNIQIYISHKVIGYQVTANNLPFEDYFIMLKL